jgi:hypothetical protein
VCVPNHHSLRGFCLFSVPHTLLCLTVHGAGLLTQFMPYLTLCASAAASSTCPSCCCTVHCTHSSGRKGGEGVVLGRMSCLSAYPLAPWTAYSRTSASTSVSNSITNSKQYHLSK